MHTDANASSEAQNEALVSAYEERYVDFLDALELEDKLRAALRAGDLAKRLKAAGLDHRIDEIHAAYRGD